MSVRRSSRVSTRLLAAAVQPLPEPVVVRSKRKVEETIVPVPRKKTAKTASENAQKSSSPFKKPNLPSTPLKKESITEDVPVLSPTQLVVKAVSSPADRPVQPHVSNATLVTPGGTSSVAYPSLTEQSPSKNGLPPPLATTKTLLSKACAHLISVDSRLQPFIEKHPCDVFSPDGLAERIEPFNKISSEIMGQQVSGAAARSIRNKFIGLFHEDDPENTTFPTAAQVAVTDIPRLRLAGLSQRKAEYIQGLAEKFVSGELSNDKLLRATDDEVMERLIAVRGLGKWSVEMFSCFGLKRTDIFSTGDLGVQRGMAHFYGKDVKKLKAKGGGKWKYMSEQEMLERAAPFAPYRSLFMWYMWRVEDVDVTVMQA